MKNIRLTAVPETIGTETRYRLTDHMGNRWVNRDYGNFGGYGYYSPDETESLNKWRKETSETPELAFSQHAPTSTNYHILPPQTMITLVEIETLSDSTKTARFYLNGYEPPFLLTPEPGMFYRFYTIDGAQELFLYADIKHISFKGV